MTSRRAPSRSAAFTLLEAIIATVILATVAVACLQMRTQAISAQLRIDARTHTQQAAEGLLDLAISGLLVGGIGPEEDDPRERVHWTGRHDGVDWTCVRERIEMENPVFAGLNESDATSGLSPVVQLDKYTLSIGKIKLVERKSRQMRR